MDVRKIVVKQSEAGQRIDIFLAKKTGITRSQIQKLIECGNVSTEGRTVSRSYRVKPHDVFFLSTSAQKVEGLVPEPIPIGLLYKDTHIIVVDKPAGMVVYPAAGHSRGTLMNAIAYHSEKLASTGGPLRPGVVHRLDKDTSGVMVVALDDAAYYNLIKQFRERTIHRRYVVLVYGNLKNDTGEIALPIGRSESDRKKMSTKTRRRGKEAVTRWKVLKRFECATLIEAQLGTGRTHQIRVHCASIGHPVIGDKTYGKKTEVEIKKKKIPVLRQMLHAQTLGFHHPATGEYVEFSSPVPDDMRELLGILSEYDCFGP
ncbi:MAG TPA: RNA pseudouridine synthase [Nitrospiraceae bacterium]|nr:RNA pseudouridine synthase [Nitrospiraceae bacterium]